MYVSTPAAKKHFGVSTDTLRRWAKSGKIDFILTKGNHRRYFIPSSDSQPPSSQTEPDGTEASPTKFLYARVSSSKQKIDLQHQIQFLSDLFPTHTVISDIGSGLNFRRKGFVSLLDRLFKGDLTEIVVASKDRLARFGFELIEDIFTRFNAKIIVVNDDQRKQFQEELAEDVIGVITYFTAKYSGKRKYLNKIKKGTKSIEESNETDSDKSEGSDNGSINSDNESDKVIKVRKSKSSK
jgi:putative resolvase